MLKNLILFTLILLAVFGVAYLSFSNLSSLRGLSKTVNIHGNAIQVEVADSADEQMKGLSGRTSLEKSKGMLFVFSKPAAHTFWMKDMLIPIDIIFINGEKVVTIYHNVKAKTDSENSANLTLYSSKKPADKVLEINANLAKKYKLKEGDTVKVTL